MYNLRGVAHLESVIPLRLTGGAFAVYQQLPDADKRDSGKITKALRTAFAVDSFTAYEQFVGRRLQPGETVDVFLAELRKLAVPFGGLSDKMLACAFVAGLPDTVKQLLRAGSRMDELPLAYILTRARAVLTDEVGVAAAVSAMTVGAGASVKRADATSELLCFQCNQPNHLARDCLLRRKNRGDSYGGRGRGAGRGSAMCYRCDGLGSLCVVVSGKRERGEAVCASLQSRHPVSAAALPVTNISVDGAICLALIDSGCSHCIVHAPYCASWTRKRVDVMTVSGERQRCEGVCRVCNGSSVVVDVYVVDFKPLGFDFILGINGISALGGVTIPPSIRRGFVQLSQRRNRSAQWQRRWINRSMRTQLQRRWRNRSTRTRLQQSWRNRSAQLQRRWRNRFTRTQLQRRRRSRSVRLKSMSLISVLHLTLQRKPGR